MHNFRLNPSMVVAIAAVVIAMTGTATAAHYLITSTRQIKPSVRHALKGRRGARGPTGPHGAQGVPGPAGPAGPAGPSGIASITTVDGPATPYGPSSSGSGAVASSTATCPSGSRVVGGGFDATTIDTDVSFARASATTYTVISSNAGSFS